jgi:hypothetical protein
MAPLKQCLYIISRTSIGRSFQPVGSGEDCRALPRFFALAFLAFAFLAFAFFAIAFFAFASFAFMIASFTFKMAIFAFAADLDIRLPAISASGFSRDSCIEKLDACEALRGRFTRTKKFWWCCAGRERSLTSCGRVEVQPKGSAASLGDLYPS